MTYKYQSFLEINHCLRQSSNFKTCQVDEANVVSRHLQLYVIIHPMGLSIRSLSKLAMWIRTKEFEVVEIGV